MLGFVGILAIYNNVLFILIAVEVMLLAAGIVLAISSVVFGDGIGQLFVLMILTVAAAESAVGLALIIKYYRVKDKLVDIAIM
jgi:NADH-quinone oxidoreductase subunit K